MFKVIFEFLIEPLGLPIAWYWEYIILAVIGLVAYIIAYKTVGDMYRADFISGSTVGSLFHWLIRVFIFAIIWAITFGVIWLFKLVMSNWSIILMALCGIVGAVSLCVLAILSIQKIKSSKAVNKDA
ncbi:MAG: hypothetical protein Q8S24_12690 [Eubacteriales bacterium]|nr:hypothetical protein [Eubacteriales bacterium]